MARPASQGPRRAKSQAAEGLEVHRGSRRLFPGCSRPAYWCQVHHVLARVDCGLTDIDNLVLVCGWHHREFDGRGWAVRITDGVPEWLPPPWLDPDQKPIRNTA